MLLDKIKLTSQNHLHLLTHFSCIDSTYRTWLMNEANCSQSEINNKLKVPGSKFYFDFVKNPNDLIAFINSNQTLLHVQNKSDNRIELTMSIPKKIFLKV